MKKVIHIVLAVLIAIELVVIGYFLFTAPNLQKHAVEDAACPFSWKELRNGTYQLEIDTTAYPDCTWRAESFPKGVVAVADKSEKADTAVFSILPLSMGQTYVQVYCEQTDPYTVRMFEIAMQISVSEKKKITVENTEHKAYDGVTTVGEGSDYPVQWWVNTDGSLNLLIEEENDGNWELMDYDADSIAVSGPFYRQGSCGFEIRCMKAGKFPLTIYDGKSTAISLEVAAAEDLSAVLTAFSVGTYTADRSEEHLALEAMAGKTLTLPKGAEPTEYSVKSAAGFVRFMLNDIQWRWKISLEDTEEEIVGDLASNALETKTVTVGDAVLSAYRHKDGVIVSWSDGERTMALYGAVDTTVADALAIAEEIAEDNNG